MLWGRFSKRRTNRNLFYQGCVVYSLDCFCLFIYIQSSETNNTLLFVSEDWDSDSDWDSRLCFKQREEAEGESVCFWYYGKLLIEMNGRCTLLAQQSVPGTAVQDYPDESCSWPVHSRDERLLSTHELFLCHVGCTNERGVLQHQYSNATVITSGWHFINKLKSSSN